MHGLYLLWWVQEKHVSPAVVASIMAAGNVTLMLAEVPTGWFADRFGHRASLITGSALQILGMLWCWLGEGALGLTVACILVAIADAFRSGADQALVYRSCVALDRESDFQRLEARSNAAELCGLVALLLVGGLLVNAWGFAAGWIAETALSVLGLAIACAMTEPPARADAEDEQSEAIADGHSFLSRRTASIIGPAACLSGLAGAAAFLAQTASGATTTGLTVLVAALTLAEAAGSMTAGRVRQSGPRQQIALAAAGLGTWAFAVMFPAAFTPAVALLAFLYGLSEPLRDTAIQRAAPDSARARAASLASACSTAAEAIALPLAGLWGTRRR
jgi:MFS family permease